MEWAFSMDETKVKEKYKHEVPQVSSSATINRAQISNKIQKIRNKEKIKESKIRYQYLDDQQKEKLDEKYNDKKTIINILRIQNQELKQIIKTHHELIKKMSK